MRTRFKVFASLVTVVGVIFGVTACDDTPLGAGGDLAGADALYAKIHYKDAGKVVFSQRVHEFDTNPRQEYRIEGRQAYDVLLKNLLAVKAACVTKTEAVEGYQLRSARCAYEDLTITLGEAPPHFGAVVSYNEQPPELNSWSADIDVEAPFSWVTKSAQAENVQTVAGQDVKSISKCITADAGLIQCVSSNAIYAPSPRPYPTPSVTVSAPVYPLPAGTHGVYGSSGLGDNGQGFDVTLSKTGMHRLLLECVGDTDTKVTVLVSSGQDTQERATIGCDNTTAYWTPTLFKPGARISVQAELDDSKGRINVYAVLVDGGVV